MLNSSGDYSMFFNKWCGFDPDGASESWAALPFYIQGELWLCRMRGGDLYAAAHTSDNRILLTQVNDARRFFADYTQLECNGSDIAVGTVSMVDFADGRIGWFAQDRCGRLLCSVSESLKGPIRWERIGPPVFEKPYPLARSYGGIQIFVRDSMNGAAHRWYMPEGWSDWEALEGHIAGGIVSADNGNGLPILCVRGPENAVWVKEHLVPNGWGSWISLGGHFREDPVPLHTSDDSNYVFALDFNGNVRFARIADNGDILENWTTLDGLAAGNVRAVEYDGGIVLASVAVDGSVQIGKYSGTWSGWKNAGCGGVSSLNAVPTENDVLLCAITRSNEIRYICKHEI